MHTRGTRESSTQTIPSPWLETGVSNLPYSRLVARIIAENAKEAREPLGRLEMLKINTDRRQRAFHDGANPGGLPVDKGTAVDEYAEATERKSDWGAVIDTIDWHDDRNLSLAKNYGFEPFSSLSLQNGVVIYNRLSA